jgi:hypothetical protein
VYEITGCTHPPPIPAIQGETSQIRATEGEDFSREKQGRWGGGPHLGGVVREEELLAVAEGGDGGEAALAFPAPLAQQER